MIKRIIDKHGKWIKSYQVKRFRQSGLRYELVLHITFTDDSRLVARDYRFREGTGKYSYHYQNSAGDLIFRYDNAPHFRKLENFPHHKHSSDTVTPSRVINLEKVIEEIIDSLSET
jgi:hypothetical protein